MHGEAITLAEAIQNEVVKASPDWFMVTMWAKRLDYIAGCKERREETPPDA